MTENELSETAVSTLLNTRRIGHPYHYRASVPSTSALLSQELRTGAPPHGTVLLTDYQSQGRGRLDRRWEAPPGTSLLFSVLLRPDWEAERAGWLMMLAGLAVAEAIEVVAAQPVVLKWPNDVLLRVEGTWRKTCGILQEGELDSNGRLRHAILGIGINVNVPSAQLPAAAMPATSLLAATGRPVSRRDLLVAVLANLETHYEAADGGQSPRAAWRERLITLGRSVRVTRLDAAAESPLEGVAEDVDEWGSLLVRDAVGRLHAVAAGDVTLRDAS